MALWLLACPVLGSQLLRVDAQRGAFPLVANGKSATICVAATEPIAVRRAAQLFAEDVERVTGQKPVLSSKVIKKSVVIATLGHNAAVDKLVAQGRLDVSSIRDGWEQYVIRVVDGSLYIVGSDRRGAAYGVFSLSEAMGVSPWYWWADVPVRRQASLYVDADYASTKPSVKYRGIFINDEDWGLKPWASHNYERSLGDIGPKTYARVCELLLRLKANMLAPAMHSCTGAFYSHTESKVVCDSFAIIVTTSHCEPLLLNNAAKSEWDSNRDGEWNYKTNRDVIWKKWDDRLAEASQYENIYTTAMRGVHDEGLKGNLPMNERVPLLEKVISDQRDLLKKHKAYTPLAGGEVSQIFVPYKETMDIYEHGLQVPDDITLVWVDDNYGYMKRVSNPAEQKRSGRAGVYYHLSYLGAPHDYLWLNTTPPVLMYEELKKAYDCGADRYWLLNVGDIKPMELGMQTFFAMAWNIDDFSFETVRTHQAEFLHRLFYHPSSITHHPSSITRLQSVLDDYYRLAWSRKPEFMGWEYEWDDKEHTGLKPTEFSFRHYDEAQRRLADYQRISDEVERLSEELRMKNEEYAAAFFELLQFPVQGACQMNRKFLMAQLNQELAAEGRLSEANWAARQMEQAYDSINALNLRYNKQLNGKWDGMMALSTSFTPTCQYYQKPVVQRFDDAALRIENGELRVENYDMSQGSVSATKGNHNSQFSTLNSPFDERSPFLRPFGSKRPEVERTESQGCHVVDLTRPVRANHVTMVRGLGYDGTVVQFGDPTIQPIDGAPADVIYDFPATSADSVDVVLYTVPFWPLYEGKTNSVGVSIDQSAVQVFENHFQEYSRSWKDQVMRNGAVCRLRFAIDPSRSRHQLRLVGDPGQMVQRVIIDWGGLQASYIGPQIN